MRLKRIPRVVAFAAGLSVSLAITSIADIPKDLAVEQPAEISTKELSSEVDTIEVIIRTPQVASIAESPTMQSITRVKTVEAPAEIIPEAQLVEVAVEQPTEWEGEVLNSRNGTVKGPSGKETYYNLDMSGVISIMKNLGYDYKYHIREDGVKMYGPYIMCAANLNLRPRGTILETTLGTGIVCDTGDFAKSNPTQIDIAVNW